MKFIDEALIRVEAGDGATVVPVSVVKNIFPKAVRMGVMVVTVVTFI